MINKPTYQQVEFVQPQVINPTPFTANSEDKHLEINFGERKRETYEERRETVDEFDLVLLFVGVPDAVEQAFPDLLHLVVGEGVVGGEPCFEDAEGFGSCGFVAGC